MIYGLPPRSRTVHPEERNYIGVINLIINFYNCSISVRLDGFGIRTTACLCKKLLHDHRDWFHSVRFYIQDVAGGKVNILGGHKISHCKQKVCPIPNGFRGRAISLYSSKIIDKRYYVLFLIFIVQVTSKVKLSL
jgi:hypothetical protein